jgi:hypothetical protein
MRTPLVPLTHAIVNACCLGPQSSLSGDLTSRQRFYMFHGDLTVVFEVGVLSNEVPA